VEVSLSPVLVQGELLVMSAIRDLTERQQAEATVRQQTSLIELAHDAIIVRDADSRVLVWNAGAEELYGWPRAAALGQVTHTLLGTRFPDSLAVVDAALAQYGQWEGELVHRCRDGRLVTVESRHVLVRDASGAPAAILEVNRDITARRQAEAAQRAAVTAAEQANAAKSEFLSRMSHELRTPLNAILGFGQLLELEASSPRQEKNITHILTAGRHLLDLINEVLEIARIESGRLSLSLEPVRLRDVVRETLDLVRPLAADRHVTLLAAALEDGRGEPWVRADRQRLKQVVLNLLANAVKYNRDGGTVAVRGEASEARVRLAVQDTGLGIAPEQLGRVFTPFDRLGAETGSVEGTGLGLALSKGLVEAMGGTLRVESTVAVGSTFWVELPLAQAPGAPSGTAENGTAAEIRVAGGRPRTILYVEDNRSNLELMEQVIGRLTGVTLLSTVQGQEGLALAAEHTPDLILLDVHLPDLDGHAVLRRLKEDDHTRAIPVVMVSADATPAQIARLRGAGARAYLTKPFDVRQLLALIDEVLEPSADA
jgi:PAS domain S-box-containing protein